MYINSAASDLTSVEGVISANQGSSFLLGRSLAFLPDTLQKFDWSQLQLFDGCAFTCNLQLSTDIQKQNSRESKDSKVEIVQDWMS